MPAVRHRAARLSVEEYHRLGELPVELLRGTIIEKTSKSPLHQFCIEQVRAILATQIRPPMIIRQEGPLTFADSEPEPDLAVLPGPAAQYRTSHPSTAALAIEVAVSSREIDRIKAAIYAEAGVKEYWIVCPEEREVEVYHSPSTTGYLDRKIVQSPAVIDSAALSGLLLDLAPLFSD
jgi:Uma2 family endonuclease